MIGLDWWVLTLRPTDSTFFPGHAASINLKLGGKRHVIGVFGILHPTVLKNFELP